MRMKSGLLALCLALGAGDAPAAEMFQSVRSPGGLPFWYLRREEEPRAIVVGSFLDAFALDHPDKISAPLVGSSMMDEGPKGMTAGEYNESLKDVQARCGVSSGPMASTFTVESRAPDLGEALDVCFRVVTEPALRDRDFERLRKSTVTSRARMESNPGALSGYLMRRLTWAAVPFSRWNEPEEIAKITAADVELWRREVFTRGNLVVVAVGAPGAAEFGAMIDRTFGKLPEGTPAADRKAPPPAYPGKTIVLERPVEQTALAIEGWIPVESAEVQAATIGNNVLGGGMDRRLGRAVRGEQGATYGISSGLGLLAPGLRTFGVRSALANDLAPAALKRVREEVERWRKDGVSEEETAAARGQLASSFEKSLESPGGKALTLVTMLRSNRTAEDEALYIDRLRATPTPEINRVVRERTPATLTTLIIAPKADGFGADCVIHAVNEIETCR